jgi:hypothetical protein
MHIKFLKHGSGSCAGAAKYLMGKKDHAGEERADVQVLRGDPHQTAAVADSLDFKLKYRSAVIAWAPEDKPTPEQVDAVLNDFEAVAFANMKDRVSWSAVRHDEQNGGCHIHIICARCDLETGKSFNPAPPGWRNVYDPVRDFHNARNNWARPDDPARARLIEQGRYDLPENKKRAKAALDAHIMGMVESGMIRNRQDVITELENVGEITRQGKQYISVKPEGFDKAIRLKGAIYGEQFSIQPGEKIAVEDSRPSGNSREDRQRRLQEAQQQVKEIVRSRAEYNLERYGKPDRGREAVHEIRLVENSGPDLSRDDRDRSRELGVHEVSHAPHPEPTDRVPADQNRPGPAGPVAGHSGEKPDTVPEQTASVAGPGRNVGYRSEIGYLMKNSNTEISRFKAEIDLAAWLESQGWQKDINASCRSSAVLVNGDEKLIVGKQRGNFVYKNTRTEGDQGSIIDFIQKRQGLNLGQVRKTLRPALTGDFTPKHDWKAPAYAVDAAQDKWVRGREVFDFAYLKGRGIDPATVKAYSPAIRQDPTTKDLYFLHRGQQGFSGYEIKKPDNTGRFSAGGEKTFFPLQRAGADPVSRVVVTETALDALSYAQMEGMREDTAYVSIAGNPSESQLDQLRSLCGQPRIQMVVLAHDKDKGGDEQAEKCQEALAESPAKVERETPASGKDWNEMLQSKLDQEKQEQLELIRRMEEAQKAIEKAQVKEQSQGRGMSM